MLALLLLPACGSVISLEDDSRLPSLGFLPPRDTNEQVEQDDTAEDSGEELDTADTGDTGADTGELGDTGEPVDTSGEDTSDTADTAEVLDTADTASDTADAAPPCEGVTLDVAEVSFASTSSGDATITLSGCATNLWGGGSSVEYNGYVYAATWASLPTDVNGTATATLHFEGSARSHESWFTVTVYSDQGDVALSVHVTP